MNDFDKYYVIRQAEYSDIDLIREFIDAWWRKGHILSTNRSFFEYEHVIDNTVTFVIAINRNSGEIAGILGYLYASRNNDVLDIWTGIWRVRPGERPLLGMELYKRVQIITGARNILSIGDNPKTTVRLLKNLTDNYSTFKLKHYYLLNGRIHAYSIADVHVLPDAHIRDNTGNDVQIRICKSIDEVSKLIKSLSDPNHVPYKDEWYIKHRYYDHPVYNYDVYAILYHNGEAGALLVTRTQEYLGKFCLRVVDFIGNHSLMGHLGTFFKETIEKGGLEYADIYTYGVNSIYLENAGFTQQDESDKNVIPDYFNPFEKANIDIWASATTEEATFFKADGDQDRPN